MNGDLISRSALTDAIGRLRSVGGAYLFDPDDVYAAIEAAPALDAANSEELRLMFHEFYEQGKSEGAWEALQALEDTVEVVRCRDCKYYWAPDADFYDSVCKRHKGLVDPTDESYCSYGERKDDD